MRQSELEERFWKLWELHGDKRFKAIPEYALIPKRRFKHDIAFPGAKVAVEIQGGTFMRRSAHNTGVGLHRDYEKHNLTVKEGWTMVYFDTIHLKNEGEEAIKFLNSILKREKQKKNKQQ